MSYTSNTHVIGELAMNKNLIILGNNLKNLRENANLTQKHIADYLKIDQSLISKFEKGERSISSDMLNELANLYCCPITKLLEEKEIVPEFKIAFRTQTINTDDLFALAQINRIALNLTQMNKLLGE